MIRVFTGLSVFTLLLATNLTVHSQDTPARVTLGGEEVLEVRTGLRGWTPTIRAQNISDRLRQIADDRSISSNSIVVQESEVGSEILIGDRLLMVVVDADAQAEGRNRTTLASDDAQKLRAAIDRYRFERSRRSILGGTVFALIATVLLGALLWLITKLYWRVHSFSTEWIKGRIEALRGISGELIRLDRFGLSLLGALRLLRVVLVLVLLYAYLHFVLGLFPWTRPFALQLYDYVLVPIARIGQGAVREIPNIFFVLVVIVVTRYTLKFIKVLFAGFGHGTIAISGFYPDWAMPTYRLVRILVLAFAVVMAYPYIPGSQSEAFKGISIFLGVLFSLGSSSSIANIVAGLTMVYMRSFHVGDRVRIGDLMGDVMKTRLQVTHLRTVKNEEIIVPNSKIINSEVINYSSLARESGLILHTEVTIGYDAPWRQVHALLLMAAERTPGLLKKPEPFVLQKSLDDFYVRYELNVFTDQPSNMAQLYSELHKNIQDAFNEYDVQIMSPNYEGDPEKRPVVPKERWNLAPAKSDLATEGTT